MTEPTPHIGRNPAAAAAAVTVAFERERDTKNTVRFREIAAEGADMCVGTLYVAKPTFERLGEPQQLVVSIEAVQPGELDRQELAA